ncbi:response regulator [Methanobacterium sp.]|uniref:response regulator n=1 Tax=Methanobacterium sp. TaxID=2164 RepID=UPI003C70DA26
MSLNVLIVEDESIIALDIEFKLKSAGFNVYKALSGESALKIINDKIDLILMDIQLNGKLDGIKTAIQIRKNFNTPIIYITGNQGLKIQEKIKLTEPYTFIKKPFDEVQLQETIKNSLNCK